jgi:hypothetical protein
MQLRQFLSCSRARSSFTSQRPSDPRAQPWAIAVAFSVKRDMRPPVVALLGSRNAAEAPRLLHRQTSPASRPANAVQDSNSRRHCSPSSPPSPGEAKKPRVKEPGSPDRPRNAPRPPDHCRDRAQPPGTRACEYRSPRTTSRTSSHRDRGPIIVLNDQDRALMTSRSAESTGTSRAIPPATPPTTPFQRSSRPGGEPNARALQRDPAHCERAPSRLTRCQMSGTRQRGTSRVDASGVGSRGARPNTARTMTL